MQITKLNLQKLMNLSTFGITILLSFLSLVSLNSKENELKEIKAKVLDFERKEEREYSMEGGGCDLLLHIKAVVIILETNTKRSFPKKINIRKSFIYDSKEIAIVYKIQKYSIIRFSIQNLLDPKKENQVDEFISIENPNEDSHL